MHHVLVSLDASTNTVTAKRADSLLGVTSCRRGADLRQTVPSHLKKFIAPAGFQLAAIKVSKRSQRGVNRVPGRIDGATWTAMRAPDWFIDHRVDDSKTHQIACRQLERVGSFLGVFGAPPKNRSAAFRRYHRIDRMLQHHDAVAGRERYRATGSSFADHH